MARRLSADAVKKLVGDYKAPSACVCPVDGMEFPSDGFPCEFRTCISDPKVRLVSKEEFDRGKG
ncbi:MAG: hypothetical protein JRI56_13005 [Deltaproteobacteria bacterium]|nr:hypothetical protein [Deltaproteobacteria bacterium]